VTGARHRRKGDRLEREIVDRHKALGFHAERYPLSGASRSRGSGRDVDVYLFGREEAPIVAEVKSCKEYLCRAGHERSRCSSRCSGSIFEQQRSRILPHFTGALTRASCVTSALLLAAADRMSRKPGD
jgi:hypothetical protein